MSLRVILILLLAIQAITSVKAAEADVIEITGGIFEPFYNASKTSTSKSTRVNSFFIDDAPVTNKDFAEFIQRGPEWNKNNVSKLVADNNYLSHWNDSHPSQQILLVPVVNVSWFAAEAYCRNKKGRLPNVLEWEYVAAADETSKDASKDPVFVQKLLDWYGRSGSYQVSTPVKQSKPNAWKVYDLHGLIWEWNNDFNSVFLSGDNRREGEEMKNMFCGGGSLGAVDKANYAAFMRYAMRNSLKGNYTTQHLGFRCAYDKK